MKSSKVVLMDSGGQVVVHVDINLFTMSRKDRDFFCAVVDLVRSYQAERVGEEQEAA